MTRRRKIVIISGIALIVAIAALAIFYFIGFKSTKPTPHPSMTATTPHSPAPTADPHAHRIRLLAAGDFIAHDAINQQAKQADGSYDYMPMMSDFTDIFRAADIRFCNDANLTAGAAFGISGYPKFNAPTEFARDMGRVGCSMVNVGTNHSFDRTQAAINASIDAWAAASDTQAVVGHNKNMSEHDAVHFFTVKGVKIAFLAYTTYLNTDAPAQNDYGVNVYSPDFASRQIKAAKEGGAEIIIASVRWGTEYSPTINNSQRQVAQFLSDQGVNLILGHGSHVLEPVEQLTGASGTKTTVWYSLGNFLNTQFPPETLFNGVAVIDFDTSTKQITDMSFLPFLSHYVWTAEQSARKSDADVLARHDIHMYLLEDVTQSMIDSEQLKTTAAEQKSRLQATLNTYLSIPLITKAEYNK